MIKRIKASLIFAKMRRLYLEQRPSDARRLTKSFRKTGHQSILFDAFDATLDILDHSSEEALPKFRKLSSSLRNASSDEQRYIRAYSEYYIALICNQTDKAEKYWNDLDSIPASKFVRKTLPAPEESCTRWLVNPEPSAELPQQTRGDL